MTGLETDRHVIVEIATLITDDDLTIVAEGPDLVVRATDAELAEMGDFVTAMHTSSGLLEAIKASSTTLAEAGEATLAFLRAHLEGPGVVPLCGNSIGTDRRFLAAQLPEVEAFFHYRSVDVSSVKELCRRWYPEVLARTPEKQSAHRALDDIKDSVAELQFYRSAIFLPVEPGGSPDA